MQLSVGMLLAVKCGERRSNVFQGTERRCGFDSLDLLL